MGKQFITDEVDDRYTARVTNAGKIKTEDGASLFRYLTSAQSKTSGQIVASGSAFLKSVIIGQYPFSAATLTLFNTASDNASGTEGLTAWGTSGDHVIGKITFEEGAATAAACALTYVLTQKTPIVVPFNVYCSSGIMAGISLSGALGSAYLGCLKGVTITYQT